LRFNSVGNRSGYAESETDIEDARQALAGSGIGMDQAWRQAAAIVERNWLAVLAVARELERAHYLDGERLLPTAGACAQSLSRGASL
jgi:hypothetical protein